MIYSFEVFDQNNRKITALGPDVDILAPENFAYCLYDSLNAYCNCLSADRDALNRDGYTRESRTSRARMMLLAISLFMAKITKNRSMQGRVEANETTTSLFAFYKELEQLKINASNLMSPAQFPDLDGLSPGQAVQSIGVRFKLSNIHEFVDDFNRLLNRLTVPGRVKRVKIIIERPSNSRLLESIEFPDDLIPENYLCPISCQIIDFAAFIIDETHHFYDEATLGIWLLSKTESPMTKRFAVEQSIRPNNELTAEITLFVDKAKLVSDQCNNKRQEAYRALLPAIQDKGIDLDTFSKHVKCYSTPAAMNRLAVSALREGNYDVAEEYFILLSHYFDETSQAEAKATSFYNLSSTYLRQGKHEQAHEAVDQCIAMRVSCLDRTDPAITKAREKKQAIVHHKEATELFNQAMRELTDNKPSEAKTKFESGMALYPFKDDKKAEYVQSQLEKLNLATDQCRPARSAGATG